MDEEKRLIAFFNAKNSNFGYNVALGGGEGTIYKEHPRGMLGKTHSEEYKARLRIMMSGANNVNFKAVIATVPDGRIERYVSKREAMKKLNISSSIIDRLIKTKMP